MSSIGKDLRYAVRSLLHNPGFATVALLSLALGIGANTTMFSVINALLYRPLPFDDPDRLVVIHEQRAGRIVRADRGRRLGSRGEHASR